MKTYVINMEKDAQKRALIESQLIKQEGLDVTVFKAIEGRKLNEDDLNRLVDREALFNKYRDFATLPAIGCSLSHWGVYDLMLKNGDEYALILEDDALLSNNLCSKIKQLEAYLLDDHPTVVLLTPDFVYRLSDKVSMMSDEYSLFALESGTMASGYLINKSAAKLLKEKLMPISYLADAWGDFIKFGLRVFGVVPHMISFPDGLGEIGRSQHNIAEMGLLKRIRYFLAGIKGRLYVFFFIDMRGMRISRKKW